MKTREEIAQWEELYKDEIAKCEIIYGKEYDTLTYTCNNTLQVVFKRTK